MTSLQHLRLRPHAREATRRRVLHAAVCVPPLASSALALAGAVIQPVAVARADATSAPLSLRFSDFYSTSTTPLNLELSEKIKAADGQRIVINGYMAPPLKPDLDFFVLTRRRLAVCPFCSTAADWPEDILLVTLQGGQTVKQVEDPVTVTGRLEVGEATDDATGFFSLLRLRADSVDLFHTA